MEALNHGAVTNIKYRQGTSAKTTDLWACSTVMHLIFYCSDPNSGQVPIV